MPKYKNSLFKNRPEIRTKTREAKTVKSKIGDLLRYYKKVDKREKQNSSGGGRFP